MAEIINKLFEKFPGVRLVALGVDWARFRMCSGRVLVINMTCICLEIQDGVYSNTVTSEWIDGVLKGKKRNNQGELV